jgi:hypothetical protein
MLLRCIRKRLTDGLRCGGTWACAWDRSQDRLGTGDRMCHTLLRWQQLANRKAASDSRVKSRLQSTPQGRHRTGLRREQMSLWLAGYPKTPLRTSDWSA